MQFWGEIVPNPMQAAGVGDTFEVIPNAEEIRALQASIRLFLAQNEVQLHRCTHCDMSKVVCGDIPRYGVKYIR